ncbi:MAG TPA: FAD-dependent oxidoreductase [Actinomycetota bacterium]|nr:FAD-dependent oxidoreductase [Actinomycetota bacterium]
MDPQRIFTDVVIIGAGAAGLFTALNLPPEMEVVVVDKGRVGQGSSPWAQGGIAAALGDDDSPDLHARDTMRVAGGHADPAAVAVLCWEAPECVRELVRLGCAFDRNEDRSLHLAREGGQSVARSAHAEDATGAAVMQTLREHAVRRVRRIEGSCLELAVSEGRCVGAWVLTASGVLELQASSTVVATGGAGALWPSSTNPPGATGDGWALAWEAGAGLADLEFVQFHPTTLAVGRGAQRPLLTEALRGAGAHVVDGEGRRFLFEHHSDGELAPRDVVAWAISQRAAWLDCTHLGRELLEREFPTILAACRSRGLDPVHDLLPVAPAAHYSIGGVQTDLDGRSSVPRLYAVGECASTGVHGANRLAGNSLAEALVFGRRAARAIAGQRPSKVRDLPPPPKLAALDIDHDACMKEVRSAAGAALGIEREPDALRRMRDGLEELARLPLPDSRSPLEVRSAAIAARLVARAAWLRGESRGVHRRVDEPAPHEEWAGVRLRLARTRAGDPHAGL